MSTMYGADVAQLRQLASQFDARAQALDADRMTVGNAIQISAWVGPVAVRFRHAWESDHSRSLHAAAVRLRDAATRLRANADEQERASAVDAGAGSSSRYAPYGSLSGIRVTPAGDPRDDDVPRGAWNPAEIIQEFGRDGTYGSRISIRTITHADGTRSHIIYVPGTQDWDSSSSNVFDGVDNLSAKYGGSTKATAAILEAMRQQGIDPDEPILLAGHSQGAMIAANLAADPDFRSHYKVEGVVTYGATIEDRHIPQEVAVTQVRNRAEIVTQVTDNHAAGVQNLNRIDSMRIDIQTPHARDTSVGGRFLNAFEAVGSVFDGGVPEHNDPGAYARSTVDWYRSHQDEWNREYKSFQTASGDRSTMTRYDVAE